LKKAFALEMANSGINQLTYMIDKLVDFVWDVIEVVRKFV
jgi:hypothetical protein